MTSAITKIDRPEDEIRRQSEALVMLPEINTLFSALIVRELSNKTMQINTTFDFMGLLS